jgi:serine/threonine-protein kinase/endoribonuclease IRE1
MVNIKHMNRSSGEDDPFSPASIDDYLWVVEPSQDGNIYIYMPGGREPRLAPMDLTMKRLVEDLAPLASDDPYVIYNGQKRTEMVTIDAHTGELLGHFGMGGAKLAEQVCLPQDAEKGGCPKVAKMTIGRITYTVDVEDRRDGHHIATLNFSEWMPNNFDQDLQRQYLKMGTLDNKYIQAGSDGEIIAFDLARHGANPDEPGKLFRQKFSSPVVRVFDVASPWGMDKGESEFVILPQPSPPLPSGKDDFDVENKIFLNHTKNFSWYAMSGRFYPGAIEGRPLAKCNQREWQDERAGWDLKSSIQFSEALVGVHSLDRSRTSQPLLLSGSTSDNQTIDNITDTAPALRDEPTVFERIQRWPTDVFYLVLELWKNPIFILLLAAMITSNQRQIRAWVGRLSNGKPLERFVDTSKPLPEIPKVDVLPAIPEIEPLDKVPVVDSPANPPSGKIVELLPEKPTPVKDKTNGVAKLEVPGEDKPAPSPEKEKRKAHRGRRGGVKHKKGRDRAASQDASSSHEGNAPQPKMPPTVDDAIRDAKNMGQQSRLEPDVQTVPSDPQTVTGPIIRIGALEVDTDRLIGTGSNGTMVFQGKFDGREVAVKRMLIQFFDIASQETKLLRESDDHPNVIRYFAQQQAAGFLYIALELCPASLADVIDKPSNHRELAQAGERDLPNVLYQIANGLHHLHRLRIVHRDLKPQNILVTLTKDGKPRLLVSDFGLCKKLEGEQSSFRATTAHAAGTSGWRAPELLLDDDANHTHQSMIDASTEGNSGSIVLNPELLPNRRATRAIDIFSLGLVFFYVLTKGAHPFDCGDRYMREVNIRKGIYNLEALQVLGDYAYEAKDLIKSMLHAEPKQRPQAHQVMAHPFFWSPKKRLNFLVDVSDHFEKEKRDPPSDPLKELEAYAPEVCRGDFLKLLGRDFVESMGKQRKYTGNRLLDLLRALRNKKNHYEDMSDKLKKDVGPLPEGYLSYWTRRFPNLLITCWQIVYELQWDETDRFKDYYLPAGL